MKRKQPRSLKDAGATTIYSATPRDPRIGKFLAQSELDYLLNLKDVIDERVQGLQGVIQTFQTRTATVATKPAASVMTPISVPSQPAEKARTMSPDARARIAASQKKRWAEYHRKSQDIGAAKTTPAAIGKPQPNNVPLQAKKRTTRTARYAGEDLSAPVSVLMAESEMPDLSELTKT
jgi:hypothetical protein